MYLSRHRSRFTIAKKKENCKRTVKERQELLLKKKKKKKDKKEREKIWRRQKIILIYTYILNILLFRDSFANMELKIAANLSLACWFAERKKSMVNSSPLVLAYTMMVMGTS